jgi:hypothetical protein
MRTSVLPALGALALILISPPAPAGDDTRPAATLHAAGHAVGGPWGPPIARPYRPARCVAAAFRAEGAGPRIRGTRAAARAPRIRHACRKAVRRCYRRLAYRPHGPWARCVVLRAAR